MSGSVQIASMLSLLGVLLFVSGLIGYLVFRTVPRLRPRTNQPVFVSALGVTIYGLSDLILNPNLISAIMVGAGVIGTIYFWFWRYEPPSKNKEG
jgi:hypothetical protein